MKQGYLYSLAHHERAEQIQFPYTPAHMDADYHPCLYSIFIFFHTHVTGFERLVHEPLNL